MTYLNIWMYSESVGYESGGWLGCEGGDTIFTLVIYALAVGLTALSYRSDPAKTRLALRKAWKSFENILPELLGVLVLIGIALAVLQPSVIAKLLGTESGWFGVMLSAVIGAVTLIPGFVAFPLAGVMLNNGAGLMQMGAFVSTLMMVGVVTLPMEIRYFGRRLAIARNALAFGFSFLVAWVIGRVV